jgi:hypothetical protein
MRRGLWACVVAAFLLSACAGPDTDPESGTVSGIVIDIVGELNDIESFTVLSDGERQTFELLPDADYAFPPGHLQDHLRSGDPVRVGWEERAGTRVAVSLDDA